MAKSKTKAQLESEIKVLRGGCWLEAVTKLLRTVVIVCGFMYAMYIVGEVAEDWSGKDTTANINVIADLQASAALNTKNNHATEQTKIIVPFYSWLPGLLGLIFGIAGISYGRAESRARRDIIERMHPYQEAWEKEHDPKRTTSKLTKRGDTRPEDM